MEIINKFNDMIHNSWTYQRMTKEEQNRWNELLFENRTISSLKGCDKVKWNILQACYHSYLIGLGYDNFNWRESEAN